VMLIVGAPVFSHTHIAVTAAICALLSLVLVFLLQRGTPVIDALLIAVVVLVTVYVWRTGANMPQLNEDGFPGVSANDLLTPLLTYVAVGIYSGVRDAMGGRQWERARALIAALTLIVNVVTI